MIRIGLLAAAFALSSGSAHAETRVADMLRYRLMSEDVVTPAGQVTVFPLHLKRSDVLEVLVALSDSSVSGIRASVCPASEAENFVHGRATQNCRGFAKQDAGGEFTFEVFFTGDYVLLIDNTFANFFRKESRVDVMINRRPDAEMSSVLRSALDGTYRELKAAFQFPDFELSIASCGQPNAFSEDVGGHITVCSELFFEANRLIDPDVLTGVLMHELGHTLLNLWGLPNYQNEQTADEFATVILVLSGKTAVAEKYLAFFSGINPIDEAAAAEMVDSPHPLSIQRMRNVGRIIDAPQPYVRRWLPILYRNMTSAGLQGEIDSPSTYSDVELARRMLSDRRG